MEKAKAHAISIIIFISVLVFLFFAGRAIIYWQLDRAIHTALTTWREEGIDVTFGNKALTLWDKSLDVQNVTIQFRAPHPLAPSAVSIKDVSFIGLSLIPLIAKKEIVIKEITILKPVAFLYQTEITSSAGSKKPLKAFTCKLSTVTIDSLTAIYLSKSNRDTLVNVSFNASIKQLDLFTTDVIRWSTERIAISNIAIVMPPSFYKITARQLLYTSSDKRLQLDSALLTPTLSRIEFARKSIYQTDRITAVVPSLIAHGVEVSDTFTPSVKAASVALSFSLDVFHDKRFPPAKARLFLLPAAFMKQLPFPLHVDSVNIHTSSISYEEFPVNGTHAGKLFFNALDAKLRSISTDGTSDATMHVTARFMDAGDLKASFTFPMEKNKLYTVMGSLRHFQLKSINAMLTPLEHLKMETGNLRDMNFQFNYNEHRSTGLLVIDYSNLRVSVLQKNSPDINVFATFVANTLLKNTMDNSISELKRTGDIIFIRDPYEGIFGYWWKSLRAGIKSVFTMKKIISANHKRDKPKKR